MSGNNDAGILTILWRKGALSLVGSGAVFQYVEISAVGWVNFRLSTIVTRGR